MDYVAVGVVCGLVGAAVTLLSISKKANRTPVEKLPLGALTVEAFYYLGTGKFQDGERSKKGVLLELKDDSDEEYLTFVFEHDFPDLQHVCRGVELEVRGDQLVAWKVDVIA